MNAREQTLEGVATLERELADPRLSQDTLVRMWRDAQHYRSQAASLNLPTTRIDSMVQTIDGKLTAESRERVNGAPISPPSNHRSTPFVRPLSTVNEPPEPPPCAHDNKHLDDDTGRVTCSDCGHSFEPATTDEDREKAITDLFGSLNL